ncbi:hypothetical protein LOZ58_006878 [Ophidiomyces ophidiicola]|nr:hypothetical protein LOZ58_006878 [Ophidiomyces ophidiicola]
MGGPDPYRASRQQFNKRSTTVLSKAMELVQKCDAKLYLLMVHERGVFEYNSTVDPLRNECNPDPEWPPPVLEVAKVYPNVQRSSHSLREFKKLNKHQLAIIQHQNEAVARRKVKAHKAALRRKLVVPDAPDLVTSRHWNNIDQKEKQA